MSFSVSIRSPLLGPLIVGALARLCSALIGAGFHARDDYFHVLEPALLWIANPDFEWEGSTAHGAGIRSHLLPRLMQGLVLAAHGVGIESPEAILRILHSSLGLYSLLLIPGIYCLGRQLADERVARLAAWLGAVHFAMPYVGTRLLLEAVAIPPLVWGLHALSKEKTSSDVLGGLLLALALWFRYQIGAAVLGVFLVVLIQGRKRGLGFLAERFSGIALGLGLGLAAQGTFDMLTHGRFLGPLVGNVLLNLTPPTLLTRSGPYTYVGLLLLLTTPPATLLLLPAMVRAVRRYTLGLVTWPLVTFTLLHTLVPHKEERFLTPMLPLMLLLLAAAYWELEGYIDSWGRRARTWWPAAKVWLIVTHTVMLLIASTTQSQSHQRDAMASLREDPHMTGAISMGPELLPFFLGRRDIPIFFRGRPDAVWLKRTLDEIKTLGFGANRFLGFESDRAPIEILLAAEGYRCDEPQRFGAWWADNLVYTLNPRHNRRRAPIFLWRCEVPSMARSLFPRSRVQQKHRDVGAERRNLGGHASLPSGLHSECTHHGWLPTELVDF